MSNDLKKYINSTSIGTWAWDIEDDVILWDDNMLTMFGITRAEWEKKFNTLDNCCKKLLTPEDAEKLYKVVRDGTTSFSEVMKIYTSTGSKYVKMHGERICIDDKEYITGVSFRISKREYYSFFEGLIKDIGYTKHFKAKRTIYSLKGLFTSPCKISEPTGFEWREYSQMENTKWRRISHDTSGVFICQFITQNSRRDSHYHLEDELLTNNGDTIIDVWIEGEYYGVEPRESVLIPAKTFHKIAVDGIGNIIVTWFDYYSTPTREDTTFLY